MIVSKKSQKGIIARKKKFHVSAKTLAPFLGALLTFVLTELFSRFPNLTERIYSQTIFPRIASILTFFSKWAPFSLDDVLYTLLILLFLTMLIMTIFRKLGLVKFLLLSFQSAAILYILFYWLWGFNYYRSNLNERLSISKAPPDSAQFIRVLDDLIAETNRSYCSFDRVSKPEIARHVESSYQKLALFLKIKYPQGVRVAKPITYSSFFAKATIAGYYGPFFSEIQINNYLLPIEYPQVLAHESAHQLGVTGEAEANFYSWLVCTQSNSQHLRYSANINTLGYFLAQARRLGNYRQIIQKIDKPVIDDLKKISLHWEKLRNKKIDKAAGKVNDIYLKTNKIKQGIDDYFGVVRFVMDFRTDSTAMKKAAYQAE
jgi:hypothetical protein